MSAYPYVWQWTGTGSFDDILYWCRRHFGYAGWTSRDINFYFVHEQDYLMFLLRWSSK